MLKCAEVASCRFRKSSLKDIQTTKKKMCGPYFRVRGKMGVWELDYFLLEAAITATSLERSILSGKNLDNII